MASTGVDTRTKMDRRDVELSLVQGLLAAPGSIEGWQSFLAQLCDALHGCGANFISHNLESSHSDVAIFSRTDPAAVDEYQRHWCREDAWRNAACPGELKPGGTIVGDAVIARDRFARTSFYNEFGRRYDIAQSLAGIVEASPTAITNLSVNRSDGSPRFDVADAELLEALLPHVKRAVDVHRRLGGAELMATHASAVVERLPHGVLLMTGSGTVVSTNRAADAILRARDGLTLKDGELTAAVPSMTLRLRTALHAAIRTSRGDGLAADTAIVLPRPSGRRPLSVLIAPLPVNAVRIGRDDAAVAVFVTDPENVAVPDVGTIRVLLDLTRAEAELVCCLVAGLSLEQASARLGLRPQTLRSRLKIIFQKTDTHRQADLVRLVLTSSAAALV